MAIKVKLGNNGNPGGRRPSLRHRILRGLLIGGLACLLLAVCVLGFFYFKYQRAVEDRLAAGPLFANAAQIYAAPPEVRVGQHLSVTYIAQELRTAGYNTNTQMGTFTLNGNSIYIKPGPQSYHSPDGATITTGQSNNSGSGAISATSSNSSSSPSASPSSGPVVLSIKADNGASLAAYQLEPQLITALSEDKNRTKRRLVTYDQIPTQMVQAVTAIEDRRFFEHGAVNYVRMGECVVQDILAGRKECGGSTLTQQLAKAFFLTPDKTISRKIAELMIAYQLEGRFSKQQIFAMYANEMNLVHRGSYEIDGVAETSQTLFGKDLHQLDLAQCALIAALFQNPSYRNPYIHQARALERRNLVLDSMVETGAISRAEADRAKAEPLDLAHSSIDAGEAPYFVDLVHDQLAQRISDPELEHDTLRIYTSLDPELQRAASEAVDIGMKNVDEMVRRLHRKNDKNITYPQVALVAINPHTGQVLALIGGRNYGVSQLDHAVSERPTGSIFKPFVYAAAYNTSLAGTDLDGNGVFTALTRLNDDPQTFMFDGKPYDPGNFVRGEMPGMVTAAQAIAKSLNIATINLAQQVGYENVAALARSAGIVNARGTPSVAIGTYDATPLDMAGAYTVFANNGVHLKPWMLASVRNANGDIVADFAPEAKQVLDPRVAYLTQSLLEFTATYGTAASIRNHGFTAPAAGKTGTEHDAWFAGYTSNLLCIIWVGNDDYTDISHGLTHQLQGADTAAPIWAEFMNRAIKLPQYSDMKQFSPTTGVQLYQIDQSTWLPADSSCPVDYTLAFLDGTVPNNTCSHPNGETPLTVLKNLFGFGSKSQPLPIPAQPTSITTTIEPNQPSQTSPPNQPGQLNPTGQPNQPAPPKKKTLLQKIFGGGNDKTPQPASQPLPQ